MTEKPNFIPNIFYRVFRYSVFIVDERPSAVDECPFIDDEYRICRDGCKNVSVRGTYFPSGCREMCLFLCTFVGMKATKTILLSLCLFLAEAALPQRMTAQPRFRAVTWNIENMFYCTDDSLKQDEEYLPDGERQWTWGRFWRKAEDVSRVIMGIGGDVPPALVALEEVEDDSVMIALSERGPLRVLGYKYVMTDSPDPRGMDVALLYQPLLFRLLGWEAKRVASERHGLRPTRDLLHVWGRVPGGDTIHVVVCHLPSRVGGREGQRNRRLAVETLAALTDSLMAEVPHCRLLVMGDFNATLRDRSLRTFVSSGRLLPLTPDKRYPAEGTYRFRGDWSWIDHIFVSPALREKVSGAMLYTQPWMQRRMADGTWYPRRTYLGTTYNGGVSDHVPVYADICW